MKSNGLRKKVTGQLSVAFCGKANSFVLKYWIDDCNEWLCLHADSISQERQEITDFLSNNATSVHFVTENGRSYDMPFADFDFIPQEGYLEHNSKNIIINVFQPELYSYTYSYDERNEMINKSPIHNIIIS